MKIRLFNDTISKRDKWCIINVTQEEALHLIESLAHQIRRKDPNTGRLESRSRGAAQWCTVVVNDKLEAED